MATRTPNGDEKKLGFVAKVRVSDEEFKPVYIAPDATDSVQGDVLLSDATDGTEDAKNGMTAATPKAVATVRATADNKLDMTETAAQTVAGPVTFSSDITGTISKAKEATKLSTARNIKLDLNTVRASSSSTKSSTVSFDGTGDVTFQLPEDSINVSLLNGTISTTNLPGRALTDYKEYTSLAALYTATTTDIQTGDIVYVSANKTMYLVIDDTKLNSSDGYKEIKASSAVTAEYAANLKNDTSGATLDVGYDEDKKSSLIELNQNGKSLTVITVPSDDTDMIFNGRANTAQALASDSGAKLSVGSTTQPVYFKDGVPAVVDALKEYAGSDAGLVPTAPTDKTSKFLSAAGSWDTIATYEGDTAGLVPAAPEDKTNKFLGADGSWNIVNSGVTGVKGDAEDDYRTGQVNITAENIGALSLKGGSVTGHTFFLDYVALDGITQVATLNPSYNTSTIGTSTAPFADIYATKLHGTLDGTATSAKSIAKSIKLTGDISTQNIDLSTTDTVVSCPIQLNNGVVDADVLASSAVETAKIKDAAVTTAKVNDKAITNAKLADEVGTVYISNDDTAPTEEHIKLWIKI
jgi:hypothetical protein